MTSVVCVGLAVLDLVFATPELPSGPRKHFATDFREVGGGPAANAAVTVASLGGKARFIGRVGDDALADRIIAELEQWGVDTSSVQRVPGRRSPLSAVFVDRDGERMIVNYTDPDLFGDGDALRPQELEDADAVIADNRWPSGAEQAFRAAKDAGIPGLLDLDLDIPADVGGLLRAASHVAFSAPRLAGITGTDDPGEGLRRARGRTDAWLAVTVGADGVLWLDGSEIRHLPAFSVDAVDTLGAGDVFHGALALGLGEGMVAEGAIRLASATAALKCTRFGGRAGIPGRAEVEAFLEKSS